MDWPESRVPPRRRPHASVRGRAFASWGRLAPLAIACAALATAGALVLGYDGPLVYVAVPLSVLFALLYRRRGTLAALLLAAARGEGLVAKAAELRLSESERALAEAQRLARIGSFEWDIVGERSSWSEELFHIFGLDRAQHQASHRCWQALIHEDDSAVVDAAVAHAYQTCEPFSFVHRIVRPDGHTRTIECHGRVEVDQAGTPVRMIGTAHDVTAFKLAEERFRSLFETAPYALVVVDGEGSIVLVNSEVERVFGHSRAELIDRPVEKLVPAATNAARQWYREPLDRIDAPDGAGSEFELYGRRRDGSLFPVEVSLTTLRTEEETLVSAAFKDVTDRKSAAEALAHQATHDPLTGLPNRNLFLDRLEHSLQRAKRSARTLSVLFLDLDDFKVVNDTFGHDVGDRLLLALTPRLRAALRPGDTIARFGGDEFVVLCEDLTGADDALAIAQRIAEACSRPVMVGGHEHVVTVSAGVVLIDDPLGATPSSLLRDADAAMYRAKARGKGSVELFDEALRARLVERFGLESQLRRALDRGELRIFYQPVVSLRSGQIVAVEALVRWQHPERGLLAPADFMSVAQRSGLIVPIDDWVIEQACHQAASWRDAAPGRDPVHVAVNLSPRKLAGSDVAGGIAEMLAASGLDPSLLELEITESTLLADLDACARSLRELKSLGVRVVLDDFGSGYSSLGSLKRLTIDGLKIDPSFVGGLGSDAEDAAIVSAVLGIAQALEVGVTAEGVETASQLASLREYGCPFAQGFLFGHPAPPAELGSLIGVAPLREELSA